jgi:hypothetical protein
VEYFAAVEVSHCPGLGMDSFAGFWLRSLSLCLELATDFQRAAGQRHPPSGSLPLSLSSLANMASVATIYGFCSLAMFYARVANASAFVDTYKVMHPPQPNLP